MNSFIKYLLRGRETHSLPYIKLVNVVDYGVSSTDTAVQSTSCHIFWQVIKFLLFNYEYCCLAGLNGYSEKFEYGHKRRRTPCIQISGCFIKSQFLYCPFLIKHRVVGLFGQDLLACHLALDLLIRSYWKRMHVIELGAALG